MKTILLLSCFLIAKLTFAQTQNIAPENDLYFQNGAVQVHTTWEKGPMVNAESVLKMQWKNTADHTSIDAPGAFKVVLWMPAMGHGSSPTKLEPVLDSMGQNVVGEFLVTHMYFIMGDLWEVNVVVSYPNGTQETQNFTVTLPMVL